MPAGEASKAAPPAQAGRGSAPEGVTDPPYLLLVEGAAGGDAEQAEDLRRIFRRHLHEALERNLPADHARGVGQRDALLHAGETVSPPTHPVRFPALDTELHVWDGRVDLVVPVDLVDAARAA